MVQAVFQVVVVFQAVVSQVVEAALGAVEVGLHRMTMDRLPPRRTPQARVGPSPSLRTAIQSGSIAGPNGKGGTGWSR